MNLLHNPDQLKQVISLSSFEIYPGTYVYTRVERPVDAADHLMVINDGDEITVVTLEENLLTLGPCEINKDRWRLINIKCGNPFYCVGFIATITTALSEQGIDVVLTSSFTKDLVMVMEKDLARSAEVLMKAGFSEDFTDRRQAL